MDNDANGVIETGEDILVVDLPDDALERAAAADGRIVTLVYCTQDSLSCGAVP